MGTWILLVRWLLVIFLAILYGLMWLDILLVVFQTISEALVDAVGSGMYTSI